MKRIWAIVLGTGLFCTANAVAADAVAQTNPSLIDPFQDDDQDAAQTANQYNGYVGGGAAVFDLFGPGNAGTPAYVSAPTERWQDLNAVDPSGQSTTGYDDIYRQRVEAVINSPLPKKKPFSDPLENFKKDPGQGTLFGSPGERGR